MPSKPKIATLFVGFLCLFGLLPVSLAQAAGGITVAPAILKISLAEEQASADASVGVRNDFATTASFTSELQGVNDQDYRLIPGDTTDSALQESVQITPANFDLESGQSINVQVHVTNTTALSPGGHYATLVIRQQAQASQQIGVIPAVSVSIFVTKEGGAIRRLEISAASQPSVRFALPKTVESEYKNTGNVDMVPRAAVTVVKGEGETVYRKGVQNQGSLPLFPGKSLTTKAELTKTARAWLPGKYSVIVRYRFDGSASENIQTQTFWYLPWQLIIIVAGLVVSILMFNKHKKQIMAKVKRKSSKPQDNKKS